MVGDRRTKSRGQRGRGVAWAGKVSMIPCKEAGLLGLVQAGVLARKGGLQG